MRKILFVANVTKEHILKFHIPTIKKFKDEGWTVEVASSGTEEVPYCDKKYVMPWKRSPFTFATFAGIKALKKIIDNGKYDIIYCHTPVGGLIGRIASLSARKRFDTRIVYFAHGLHFYKGAPLLNWLIYYPVEKILAKVTNSIITINEEDYNNSKNLLKVRETYLIDGIGVNINEYNSFSKEAARKKVREELNIPENANVLIYLAELIKNKNQKMLLDVLKQVQCELPDTYLVLAGFDHNNGKYQEYAKEIGVFEKVRFLGWRSDKANLYACADICTASSIREGFGINVVEALASGLQVVATKNRGHSTIIKNDVNGYLVDINDVEEMSRKICEIIKKQSLTVVSQEELSKYDEQIVTEKIYNFVLGEKH
ncbi:MAG: glycosyltransferase family 4 protein [Clostridia bacterium]|nr:glycosyltransferase family 4 protein [Clostridia bacterium]